MRYYKSLITNAIYPHPFELVDIRFVEVTEAEYNEYVATL